LHFFEKYFYITLQKEEKFADCSPKVVKYWLQEPPAGVIKDNAAYGHGGCAAEAQIAAADAKAQIQPAVKGGAYEDQIPQRPQLLRGGAQETVNQTKTRSDRQCPKQPPGGGFRPDHPFLRQSRPVGRGSS
jgi:hypothetical protein